MSALFHAGHKQKAIEVAREITVAFPDSPLGWLLLGAAFWNTERFDEAEAAYQEAAKIDPKHVRVLRAQAELAELRRQYDRSEALWAQAIEYHPKQLDIRIALADCLLLQGKREAAVSVFQGAMEVRSPHEGEWRLLLTALIRAEYFAMALDACDRGIEIIDHEARWIRLEKIRLLLTCKDYSFRDYPAALEMLEPLVPRMDGYATTSDLYVLALLRNEQFDRAREAAQRAIDLSEENTRLLLWLSLIEARTEHFDLACSYYYQAKVLLETDPQAAFLEEWVSESEALISKACGGE